MAESPPTVASADPVVSALYDPISRGIGCVLLQAACGGDGRPCHHWDAQDWVVSPVDSFRMISAPLSQWIAIGRLPKEQRPGPEAFK